MYPESDSEFSDLDESEDEEYTVKRKREKTKKAKSERKTSPKAAKKEKKQTKQAKTKPVSRGLYTFFVCFFLIMRSQPKSRADKSLVKGAGTS